MTDRPILFSSAMMRALLDGRKTMTRRVLTRSNSTVLGSRWGRKAPWEGLRFDEAFVRNVSPWSGHPDSHLAVPFCHPDDEPCSSEEYGIYRVRSDTKIGARIWVREAFFGGTPGVANIAYRADMVDQAGIRWRSPIFMPRAASRLTLAVTDVRVQRLNECSVEDAKAEGLEWVAPTWGVSGFATTWQADPVEAYACLWDEINGSGAWAANPWVVAVSFTVQRGNIDGARSE